MNSRLSRRHFLRAAGSLIALPALESIGLRAFAAEKPASARPKRLICIGMGFGVTQETWFPDATQTGRGYALSEGLAPMARHKERFTLFQGLTNKYTQDAHWGSTFWLTGANRYAEAGQSFHNTISFDQVAANAIGEGTRFTSLALNGGENNLEAHHIGHGPGLSLSWNAGGKPIAGINSPALLFHRLFSAEKMSLEERQNMMMQDRSVLDAVVADAKQLQRGLTKTDVDKLNEYFQSIREIEARIAKEESWMGIPKPAAPIAEPAASLQGREEVKLMYDMMTAAFQTDSTRVFTYRLPVETMVKSLGLRLSAHDISHYSPGDRMEASKKRDLAYSELMAGLLDKLQAIQEPDGTSLLDHSCVVFGSNLRNVHNLENCPTLVAGGGGGIPLGHHHVLKSNTPLCNLWLTLLKGLGAPSERHGDSSGLISIPG